MRTVRPLLLPLVARAELQLPGVHSTPPPLPEPPVPLIASADIYYGGVGLNAEQQRAPWLWRLLGAFLPF